MILKGRIDNKAWSYYMKMLALHSLFINLFVRVNIFRCNSREVCINVVGEHSEAFHIDTLNFIILIQFSIILSFLSIPILILASHQCNLPKLSILVLANYPHENKFQLICHKRGNRIFTWDLGSKGFTDSEALDYGLLCLPG